MKKMSPHSFGCEDFFIDRQQILTLFFDCANKRKITDLALLKNIAKFLSGSVGSPISVKSISDYTGDKFDTGESIDNVSTIIGNIRSVGISHFNEVYLAYAKAAKSYNAGYEEHRISKAPQSTNTHDETAEGAPKTGDAGAALPVTAGAIAFVIVLVFRKKNDD